MSIALKNNAVSKLDGSIGTGTTSISVTAGSKFPNPSSGNWFPVTVEDEAGNMEIMRCTSRSGNVLTVQRAQEGTIAKAFASGSSISLRMTAGAFTEVFDSKADVSFPAFSGGISITGNTPMITMVDDQSAGAGKRYRWRLSGDEIRLLRDKNNDGDFEDADEGAILVIHGGQRTVSFDGALTADSVAWRSISDISGTNLNSRSQSGFYYGSNFTNSPDGSNGGFWVLVQSDGTADNVVQTAWKKVADSALIFARTRVAGAWSNWKIIANNRLDLLAQGTFATSGQIRLPAYDSGGAVSADGVRINVSFGKPFIESTSANAARSALGLASNDAAAFGRIHAGGDTTVYNFETDTTACTFMNTSALYSSRSDAAGLQLQRLGSNGNTAVFYRGTSSVGSISVTATATAYNTSSDYRLKYDIEPLVTFSLSEDQAEYLLPNLRTVMALRPVSHRWVGIDAPDSSLTYGYIAHEAQQVFHACVTGQKDAVLEIGTAKLPERQIVIQAAVVGDDGDEIEPAVIETRPAETRMGVTRQDAEEMGADWEKTGERPDYQKMDASKLIPILNASIQELTLLLLEQRDSIAALEARLAQLEA